VADSNHQTQTAGVEGGGTRLPLLNEPAPTFHARTTQGERSLEDYRGRWLIFFAHPADFTPVCASEFIAFSKAYDRFQELGCDLLGLSVDSLFAHIAWIANIKERFGVEVPFPIVEDPSMAVARAYGMLHPGAHTSATVRATFVIDPEGMIRAIIWYPMNVRPTSTASSSCWSDLLARHRQPADIRNGFDRAVWPDPVGHDDGEQQQTDRDRERQRPTAGAVEDPSEGDR